MLNRALIQGGEPKGSPLFVSIIISVASGLVMIIPPYQSEW